MEGSISSLFSSDNPYKFFFLSGVLLIIIGLYYPFEKRQKLDLQKNKVELSDSTLTIEILKLEADIIKLQKDSEIIINELDSLVAKRKRDPKQKEKISSIINIKKNLFNAKVDSVTISRHKIDLKAVQSIYRNKEIEIYQGHLCEIKIYSIGFLSIGLFLLFYGGHKWLNLFKTKK